MAPYVSAPVSIHFENNSPFGTLEWVNREVEVSLWGNIAVEEHYELRHTGATLKGGFSRVDYQLHGSKGASLNSLVATLPPGASDVYYRDVIGNISTSHVRSELTRTVMEVRYCASRFSVCVCVCVCIQLHPAV